MKCKHCGSEMREEYSFVFGTTFHFCPKRCGQALNKASNLVPEIVKKEDKVKSA